MKKIIMILGLMAITLLSTNCGLWSRATAKITGNSEECFRGVKYIQFTSGATVAVDLNGKPLPCD